MYSTGPVEGDRMSDLCLSAVLLLFSDPVCVRGGRGHLGLHEQRHSEFPISPFAQLPHTSETSQPTPLRPQISKELINFYDSAYIKAVDVSGTPSKDAAIKVLDAFHRTVRRTRRG